MRIAHTAGGAVGTDDKLRADREFALLACDAHHAPAIGVISDAEKARRAIALQVSKRGQARFQGLAKIARHDDPAERLAAVVGGLQQHAAEIAAAADVNARDRAGRRAQPWQHIERGQCMDAGLGETEVALIEHCGRRARRIGFDHADIDADAIQCDGETSAYKAAADDHDSMR
jgi:hypothetical protein